MSKIVAEKQGLVLVPCGVDDDPQQSLRCRFQTRPDAACQGRQARSPGSDVTATAHVNFRSKNSFKSDVALKHAPDERPVKKADQKSEIAPARDDEKRRRRKQSLEHGDVPIFGVYTT